MKSPINVYIYNIKKSSELTALAETQYIKSLFTFIFWIYTMSVTKSPVAH